jgi:hypothetical protein
MKTYVHEDLRSEVAEDLGGILMGDETSDEESEDLVGDEETASGRQRGRSIGLKSQTIEDDAATTKGAPDGESLV